MKITAYLRVAKDPRGRHKLVATAKPKHAPLTNSVGVELPTVAFAISLDIPDSEFRKAEQVIAELRIQESEVAADVREAVLNDD